jgi:hypothetical protein
MHRRPRPDLGVKVSPVQILPARPMRFSTRPNAVLIQSSPQPVSVVGMTGLASGLAGLGEDVLASVVSVVRDLTINAHGLVKTRCKPGCGGLHRCDSSWKGLGCR